MAAQWVRIRLPVQGTRVLPWSGKMPWGSFKPASHSYVRSLELQLLAPACLRPELSTRGHCREKTVCPSGGGLRVQLAEAHTNSGPQHSPKINRF